MSTDDSPIPADKFREDVSACATALNLHLPQLAARHTGLVLMAAMAEHVGGALQILMKSGQCTPEQARTLLAELEAAVFAGLSAPSPPARPPGAATDK
jgi:hypothetical protein